MVGSTPKFRATKRKAQATTLRRDYLPRQAALKANSKSLLSNLLEGGIGH